MYCRSPNRKSVVAGLIVGSIATFAVAADPMAGVGKAAILEKPLVYLKKDAVDFVALLPPPPTADSVEQKSELAEIGALQTTRTDADLARCHEEEKLDPIKAFAPVLGPQFVSEKLPLTAKLLAAAAGDSKFFSASAKNHWSRRRPPYIDPALVPGATLEDEPSYPSGHATRGTLYALILGRMVPEKADALMARGQEIGFDRVVAAVHYPSDVVAGRVLGQAVARSLLATPQFAADLNAATEELRSAMLVAAR